MRSVWPSPAIVDVSIAQFCEAARARLEQCRDFDDKRQFLLQHIGKILYRDNVVLLHGTVPVTLSAHADPSSHLRQSSSSSASSVQSIAASWADRYAGKQPLSQRKRAQQSRLSRACSACAVNLLCARAGASSCDGAPRSHYTTRRKTQRSAISGVMRCTSTRRFLASGPRVSILRYCSP